MFSVLVCVDGCVGGGVSFRLLYAHLVAFRNLVANAFGNVLSRWVERQQLVEVAVVDITVDFLLDVGEVAHHTVVVERAGAAVYRHNPIVAVHL